MKKSHFIMSGITPVLGTLLGMSALAQIPATPDSQSPQQKIVQKYGLQKRLVVAAKQDEILNNVGCHQPSNIGDEFEAYKDFRTVVERAHKSKLLLAICTSTRNFPEGVEDIFTDSSLGIVRMTEGVTHLPQQARLALEGHEVTHGVKGDRMADASPATNAYNLFEFNAATVVAYRKKNNIPFTSQELATLTTQENTLLKTTVDAINAAARHNYPLEIRADRLGLIYAAGDKCAIDPEPFISGLDSLYQTLPAEASQGTDSHPAFSARAAFLRAEVPAVKTECINYYRNSARTEHADVVTGIGKLFHAVQTALHFRKKEAEPARETINVIEAASVKTSVTATP